MITRKITLNLMLAGIVALGISSCTTYIIPKDSLVEQFADIDSTRLVKKQVRGPFGGLYIYQANPITEIACQKKNGQAASLTNSPSIEVRVTQNNGKRTIFFFDRIFLTKAEFIGVRSRFVDSIDKRIPLSDIKLIEVQDGKKAFKYIN